MFKNMYDTNMQRVPSVFTLKDLKGFCFVFFVFGFCFKKKLNPQSHFKGENTQVWRNNKTRPRPWEVIVTSAAPAMGMLNLLSDL